MSIIIEGMKMPIDGKQFVLTVENGTWIFQECCKPAKIFTVLEIPSHGRLIDADVLHSVLRLRGKEFSDSGYGEGVKCGLADAREFIRNAPTIIPASEKESET